LKKLILATTLYTATLTTAVADIQPFIGASINSFSIQGEDITAINTNTGSSFTSSDTTNDGGFTAGISGGLFFNDNVKLNLSYYSGEENDSSILTATVTSLSIDYLFNNSGYHRGWFLGAGISNVEIEADQIVNTTSAASASASAPLIRGGYEYVFDNQLLLEVGINYNFADVDLTVNGTGFATGVDVTTTFNVLDIYLSLSYVF